MELQLAKLKKDEETELSYRPIACPRRAVMKGAFIYYSDINPKKMSGIDKKVLSQVAVLNKEGLNCKLVILPPTSNSLD